MDKRLKAWVRRSHRTKDLHPSKQKWEVIWTDPEHPDKPYKQRTKGGFSTKTSAQAWVDDFLSRAHAGRYTDPAKAEATFLDLARRTATAGSSRATTT